MDKNLITKGFASDNNSGVHHQVIAKLIEVNQGHAIGYGGDDVTQKALIAFNELFESKVHPFFVYNGTGANVIALQAMCRPYHAVIAAHTAHINVDECGAPEKHGGLKIITIPSADGKIHIQQIKPLLDGIGFEHHVQPRVISITQSTEMGTVYTVDEIKNICEFAHQNNLLVHVDGARIANAIASLNVSLNEMIVQTGVDVISFGGTKNGMMFGEAVVFINPSLSEGVKYIRKQSAQLHSKMRFIAAQFLAMFEDDLWIRNARHSNAMAQLLVDKLKDIPNLRITQKVQSNGVFAIVPKEIIPELQNHYFFYVWDSSTSEVRWMTSFDTDRADIEGFVALIKQKIS